MCQGQAREAFQACIDGGGDEDTCRREAGAFLENCTRANCSADGEDEPVDDRRACMEACVSGGGSPVECRRECSGAGGGASPMTAKCAVIHAAQARIGLGMSSKRRRRRRVQRLRSG